MFKIEECSANSFSQSKTRWQKAKDIFELWHILMEAILTPGHNVTKKNNQLKQTKTKNKKRMSRNPNDLLH